MAERDLIVDNMRLTYEGLFDASELFNLIDSFFREKGFDKFESRNIEKVRPEGKYVELELMPWKKVTDYINLEIVLRIQLSDMREVEIEKDGRKIRLNQGKVHILFNSFLNTDYENKWESKPIYLFIRTLFDKYFFRPYTDKYKGYLVSETNQLHALIKAFLNLYRY